MYKKLKIIELFLLFIAVPGMLATSVPVYVKISAVVMALLYVIYISYATMLKKPFKITYKKPSITYVIRISVVSILLVLISWLLIGFINPDLLFVVLKQKPYLWLTILFVYAFLSVIPQELLYRRFFYRRYRSLIYNKKLFAVINVICFSWCHVFLNNVWVMAITALAGIFFVYTYEKERNLRWVIFEHSLYGNIVFTMGLGEMLAFPV